MGRRPIPLSVKIEELKDQIDDIKAQQKQLKSTIKEELKELSLKRKEVENRVIEMMERNGVDAVTLTDGTVCSYMGKRMVDVKKALKKLPRVVYGRILQKKIRVADLESVVKDEKELNEIITRTPKKYLSFSKSKSRTKGKLDKYGVRTKVVK